jgi:hypothetical protein
MPRSDDLCVIWIAAGENRARNMGMLLDRTRDQDRPTMGGSPYCRLGLAASPSRSVAFEVCEVSNSAHYRPRQRGFGVLRRRGQQPKLDIMVIARELAQFQAADASLKVLFDWSELDSWPFAAPSPATVQAWKETIPSISRAAIVHDPKWIRHAALLAALLRVCDAAVRSFLPSDYDGAVIWLEQQRGDEGAPYRGRAQHP